MKLYMINCKKHLKKLNEKILELYDKGALHIMVGTLLTKFVAFFGSIVVVRLLSKDQYGLLSYVENLYSYVLLIAGFGLSNAALRYLVLAKDDVAKQSCYNFIAKNCLLRDFFIIVVCFFGLLLYDISNISEGVNTIILIALLSIPFHDFVNLNLYSIRSAFLNKKYAYLAFALASCLILGKVVGAYLFKSVTKIFIIQLLTYLFFSVFLCDIKSLKNRFRDDLSDAEKTTINKYSLQYMVSGGIWVFFMLNDIFMLSLFMPDVRVIAEYKVAYVLPAQLSIISTSIGMFIAPYFTKHESDKKWIKRHTLFACFLTLSVISFLSVIIMIFTESIISFMFGEQYLNVSVLTRWLLISAVLNAGLRYTLANILGALGRLKANIVISGVAVCVQLILDYFLIPVYGSFGVAYTNLIVYIFVTVALVVYMHRVYIDTRYN